MYVLETSGVLFDAISCLVFRLRGGGGGDSFLSRRSFMDVLMFTGSKCDADMGFESSKSMRGRSSTLSQLGSSEVIELWSKSANKSSVDFAAFCPVPCPDRRRDWGLDHETVAALEAASLRPRDGTCGRNSFKSSL